MGKSSFILLYSYVCYCMNWVQEVEWQAIWVKLKVKLIGLSAHSLYMKRYLWILKAGMTINSGRGQGSIGPQTFTHYRQVTVRAGIGLDISWCRIMSRNVVILPIALESVARSRLALNMGTGVLILLVLLINFWLSPDLMTINYHCPSWYHGWQTATSIIDCVLHS